MSSQKNFRKIIISLFSRFSYQITSILVLFFLTPLMIRTLGDYKYGIWVLATIIVGYYGYSELGISSAIERHLAVETGCSNKEKCKKIFFNGLFLNILITITVFLITLISFFLINFLKINNYKLVSMLILIMGINLALTFPFKSFSSIISANIRLEISSGINLFQLAANSLLTVALLINGYGLVALALVNLFTTLTANIINIYFAKKLADYISFDYRLIDRDLIRQILNYSGKTFLNQIADIFRFKLDEVITGSFVSVSAVTPYSVAKKLTGTANGFCLSIIGVFGLTFSSQMNVKSDEQKVKMFYFYSKFLIAFASLIFFGFLLLGKQFINLWLGSGYDKVYYPLIILATGYFISYIQSVAVSYMYSTNTHQYFAYMSILEGIANLILSLFFVIKLKMGIIGVALGTLIPISIVKIFVQPAIMSRILKVKTLEYILFFAKNTATGLIIYLFAGLLIFNASINTYPKIILYILLLSLTASLHLIAILSNEERKFITEKLFSKELINIKTEL